MTKHPVAFVDESYLVRPNHPGMYLLAAVLVTPDDIPTLIDAARNAAGPHPYHSTHLYRRGHLTPIENMLDATHAHADWAYLVAQAPLHADGTEAARQTTLTRLLHQLDQQRVRDVVLDTRANAREQQQTLLEGRKVSRSDQPDLTTYRRLVRNGDISPRLRLIHVDDSRQPALWMADAVAWAAQRALIYDEPQWWSRIAGITTVFDTATGTHLTLDSERAAPPAVNPAGERDPRQPSQSAPPPLPRHYTLTGGTTNRTQGPGQHYNRLLDQINTPHQQEAASNLAAQLTALSNNVADLADTIGSTSNNPSTATQDATASQEHQTLEPDVHGDEPEPNLG
ncbi:hypothetical protein [Actinoplanes sp. NPDC026619]|uniref:hypothetical protein n=1 Tax=Actinoplanes sp. NPDC026619 TaxID=3155798 RepID=UPI00340C0D12